jgi:hypothetical protein
MPIQNTQKRRIPKGLVKVNPFIIDTSQDGKYSFPCVLLLFPLPAQRYAGVDNRNFDRTIDSAAMERILKALRNREQVINAIKT